jgi:capsular polysaccharide biosynthesis protein
MGILFLLLLSPLDNTIKLNNDKSTLLDKTWNGSILKYFNNTGRVI